MSLKHPASWRSEYAGWRETAPGEWKRPLDSIEKFFYSASSPPPSSGIGHMMVSAGIRVPLDVDCSFEEVTTVWKSLRYHHPGIACTAEAGSLCYKVPNAEELGSWTAETIITDNSGQTGQEALARLKSSPIGILIVLPPTREIVFQVPHYHIDGIGAIKFLDLVLDAFRDPPKQVEFGDEHQNLPQSLPEIINNGAPSLNSIMRAHRISQEFLRGFPTIDLGKREPTGSEPAVRMERIMFSTEETSRICKEVREHGFTVTHMCHSAMVRVIQSYSRAGFSRYTSFFMINLREQLPACPTTTDSPVNLRLTALPGSIAADSNQGFWDLARSLRKTYTQLNKSPEQTDLHKPMYDFLGTTPVALEYRKAVHLSSIGIVEKHFAHTVDDFWIGVSSATSEVTVYVWTFKDRLTFTVWYNEAYHRQSDMKKFLQLMRDKLLSGLWLDRTW
ncbi:hypothetical protein B0J11DRAFT_512107 [Dendryphion nanum]|uniref:Uncharacterized protein n=1 Tax=Dendryphion nanum TaxID=256645 RepID=A0A9P9I5R4_9PLEO|nr:hypothetical protein B0J11DRAFT_449484 [Dendryphion nanum]KAH7111869.1 hypothetical protein B0J11DRAFT_512107 [Dendryphion nanum]